MKPEYAAGYRLLYERHWWWRAREALLLGEIERHAPPGGWGRILDVGCGDGLFFDRLARFGVVQGVEADATLVLEGSRHRAAIHIGPFDESFRPDARFGLILMLDVLEHFEDPIRALERARELLAPGGRLLITVPAFNSLWTHHDDLNNHLVRYRKGTLAEAVAAAGLTVQSSRYFMHWLVPVKLALRLLEHMGRRPRPPRVPPPWLNGLFFRVSRVEQSVLGSQGLPVGSSLLAWCGVPAENGPSVPGPRAA